jgi:hypothetical protein
MPRWLKVSLLIFGFLLVAAIPLARQFETGSIEGVITDSRGPVAGVSIETRNLASGDFFHAETDAGGNYLFKNLRPGPYSLWVEAPGHDSLWVPRVIVEGNQVTNEDIHLNSHPGFLGS